MAKYQSMAFQLLGLVCLSLSLISKSFATDFTIGSSAGWSVSNSQGYNQWAEKNRFQIGDSIVFKYPSGQDSVLLVSQNDYNNCNTDNPIKKFEDGHTVFKFTQSGSHFFISGNKDNCLKNEKAVVIVLADRNNRSSNTNPSPPPPASAVTNPSPAPEAQQPPSSPTPSEINPTPAPASDQTPPPPNAATSFAHITFLGYLGAFAASSFLLA